MPLESQRHLFDIPADVCYLNTAYMGPLLKSAAQAGGAAVAAKTKPWTIKPADFFPEVERARQLFAALIQAQADDVALVPSASYGTAVAEANLTVRPGQRLIVLEEQFPSNVYPWRRLAGQAGAELVTVARPADGDWTPALLATIDDNTALVACCHCHWTDGSLVDLARVGQKCRQVGAALVIDATQSIGVLDFDVTAIQPDFMVCGAYKWLLGPYGQGFLYVAPGRQKGQPLEENWINRQGAEDFSGLVNYRNAYAQGARRFDMGGKSNFFLTPVSVAALEQMTAWGVAEISAYLTRLTGQIGARARELGLTTPPDNLRAGHMIGLRFPEGPPPGLLDRLAQYNVYASLRGDSIRVAPHLHADQNDLDRFFEALKSAL